MLLEGFVEGTCFLSCRPRQSALYVVIFFSLFVKIFLLSGISNWIENFLAALLEINSS